MLDFHRGKQFCEGISNHVVSGTVDEFNMTVVDSVTDKMIMDVDVLSAGMVLIILGERDGGLIVTEENGGVVDTAKDFLE